MSSTTWAGLTWDQIAAGTAAIHPNWNRVVTIADDRRLDPGDVEAIQLTNAPEHELPRVIFRDGRMLTPQGLFVWHLEERGTGEPI